MENQGHSLGIVPISLSKSLERLAFYGMRSILILYVVNQLEFSHEKAGSMYGIFVMTCGILPVMGGLIGDLLLSTKTTVIGGGFIQALGCFILAIPHPIAVYTALLIIAIGTALYTPNITSLLGSLYKNRIKKLDAAMLI